MDIKMEHDTLDQTRLSNCNLILNSCTDLKGLHIDWNPSAKSYSIYLNLGHPADYAKDAKFVLEEVSEYSLPTFDGHMIQLMQLAIEKMPDGRFRLEDKLDVDDLPGGKLLIVFGDLCVL